jgi:hypothetical protein
MPGMTTMSQLPIDRRRFMYQTAAGLGALTAGIPYVVKSSGRIIYRRCLYLLLFFLWFGFVAKVYVGEFLNKHPVTGFLNHPMIQLPCFNYVPQNLSQAAIDGND